MRLLAERAVSQGGTSYVQPCKSWLVSGREVQIIALTTDDKVGMLRRAWAMCATDADKLIDAIQSLLADAQQILDEDLDSSSSNSHSSHSNMPGSNRVTDQETVRGWNQIIDGYKVSRLYLLNCANYGQDAFVLQRIGCFPNPLPAIAIPAVTIDTRGGWSQLCLLEEIDPAKVINAVVGDETIFLWLLNHPNLLNKSNNISESRGFYGNAIVGRTGGGF